MSFLYPSFLFALAAIAIPIIIHLFSFRRYKTVYFTNVKFLREVKEETSSRANLKHLLVLLARCLFIAFLVMAFAQPFIPAKNQVVNTGSKAVSIYIDNSFSMNAAAEEQPLLEQARSLADEIVNAYGPEVQLHIITNDMEGRHQRLLSAEEFDAFLDEVEESPAYTPLSSIVDRQKEVMARGDIDNPVAYILSDFQQNIVDLEADSGMNINLVPLQAQEQKNIYIDSAWFSEPVQLPGQSNQLVVRIVNTGDEVVENARLTLSINGEVKPANFSVQPQSFTYDTVGFIINTPGWNSGELSVQDFPITFDDSYYITFKVADEVRVQSIHAGQPDTYLGAVFGGGELFDYQSTSITQVDYSALAQQDFIVLNNLPAIPSGMATELEQFIANGGNVAVFPGENAELDSYNRLYDALGANRYTGRVNTPIAVGKIEVQSAVFRDVFDDVPDNVNLPSTATYYSTSGRVNTNEQQILVLKNGQPFLSDYSYGSGHLFMFTAPLASYNGEGIAVHGIFLPMIYKMAIAGLGTDKVAYTLNPDTRIELPNQSGGAEDLYKIVGEGLEFNPEQQPLGDKIYLGIRDQVGTAGVYSVQYQGEEVAQVALNYDRKESELSYLTPEQLEERFDGTTISVVKDVKTGLTKEIQALDQGKALWKLCVILALVFLAVEILLLRLWPA